MAAVTAAPLPPPPRVGSRSLDRLLPIAAPAVLFRRRRATPAPPLRAAARTRCSAAAGAAGPRWRALDGAAEKHHRLRFVRKLTRLLLAKPRHFLPLRILDRHCRRRPLRLPRRRSLLAMLSRYPTVFRLFHAPSRSSHSQLLLAVALTPAAAAIAAEEARLRALLSAALAAKLHRLLMLSPLRRPILLSKLAHLAPDLGLPPQFRSALCARHPARFRVVHTPRGPALALAALDPALAAPLPPPPDDGDDAPILDRPRKFPRLKLRRGLNLKRRHRDFLLQFHRLPAPSPYSLSSPETAERRACAVVREVLALTTERRTLVDHLTHFRKDWGLPNRLRSMLVRHPELFYVSLKGERDSVFLVEAYDDRGRLRDADDLSLLRDRLAALVQEGKQLRRHQRRSTAYCDDDDDDHTEEEEEEEEAEELDEEDDPLEELFLEGVGEGWEEFAAGEEVGLEEEMEFWKPLEEGGQVW
ncbi:ubiquitin carboxyl-terminal hydrolase family protein [Wolffia australiana]